MTLRYAIRPGSGDAPVEVTTVRKMTLQTTMNAEECSVATSTFVIDDVDSSVEVNNHRQTVIWEDTAEDDEDSAIFRGYTQDVRYSRGDLIEGMGTGGRVIEVDVADINTILGRRVMTGEDANRPAETDVARMQWAVLTNEAGLIDTSTYLNTDDPVDMDAVDYRGQYLQAVIDDCMEASGKNAFVYHFMEGNDPTTDMENGLFYDFAGSDAYSSIARLTNDPDDVDEADEEAPTFIIANVVLTRSGRRIRSGVYLPYDTGYVYGQRQSTIDEYARIDGIYPGLNVKSAAKATQRMNRLLTSLATPEDRLEIRFFVPRARVNIIKPGQRFQVKFTHLGPEGYADDYVWVRSLDRTIRETDEGGLRYFEVTINASGEITPPAAAVGAILYRSRARPTEAGDLVYWGGSGDDPGPGYPSVPTTGDVEILEDLTPPNPNWPYYGIKVTGTGTLSLEFFATTTGVLIDNIGHTITYAIKLNGVVVASAQHAASGHLVPYGDSETVTVTDLAVVPDDELTCSITCSPAMAFFRSPKGTGQAGERFVITGGSLS